MPQQALQAEHAAPVPEEADGGGVPCFSCFSCAEI
jgi:hypothetical protein